MTVPDDDPPPPPPPPPPLPHRRARLRLRVLTWNIHKGIGGLDRRYRPERVIEVLRHHDPDVVFLQEVDDAARRSRRDRQVDLLGDALGYPYRVFSQNVTLLSGGGYGNAILSRWPLDDAENVDLTIRPKKRRSALTVSAHVRVAGHERLVALANLHLGLSGFERAVQLRRLLMHRSITKHHAATPTIVGGDLNDVWGTLGPRVLVPRGFRRTGAPFPTYPAAAPARALDAIFVRGEIEPGRAMPSRLRLARAASDHLPVLAQVRVSV